MFLTYLKIIATLKSLYDKRMSNKRFRQRWRRYQIMNHAIQKIKSSKWGVSYSVWDGEELLEDSIKSIRSVVDYIQVVYQKKSWFGVPANPELIPLLTKLKKEGLVDEVIEFTPDFHDKPWHNELKKRNLGLRIAKKRRCRYFMTMDADEFYIPEELAKVKVDMISRGITHMYAPIRSYGKKPTEYLYSNSYFVQLFAKINIFSKCCNNHKSPCLVDPTRKISGSVFSKYWVSELISMHHMTSVRFDVIKKHKNSSAYNPKKRVKKSLMIVSVPDIFNLNHIFEKSYKEKTK